jgi:hypothetical protein
MLAAHLNEARGLSFAADVLTIVRPPSDPWLTQALQRSGNRRTLEDALEETFGPGVTWRLVDGEETPASTDDEPAALSSGPAGDPAGVQSVLEIFEGTVRPAHENEGSA